MKQYKPIPEKATKIWLGCWGCGDPECCDAYYIEIRSDMGQLWESSWGSYLGFEKGFDEEIQEIREETILACKFYEITPINIEDDCIYDWEGERVLHVNKETK